MAGMGVAVAPLAQQLPEAGELGGIVEEAAADVVAEGERITDEGPG